jgi:ABC-type phosphate/phosphonate transport system substrate-binding protein
MTQAAPSLLLAADAAPTASLAMYDPPELQAANDGLWAAIANVLRRQGYAPPEELTREGDLDAVWRNPNLVLAHACGYPLNGSLKGLVQVVATPRYRAQGCDGAYHRAAIVVRSRSGLRSLAALRGKLCAINGRQSNTGMNLLRARIAPLAESGSFFGEVRVTGSHAASLAAVAEGAADVASIDAVSLALINDLDAGLADEIRVLGWTAPSPGLPLITAAATPLSGVAALRQALEAVATDPELAAVRSALRLAGFSVLADDAYAQVASLEAEAVRHGYPDLA